MKSYKSRKHFVIIDELADEEASSNFTHVTERAQKKPKEDEPHDREKFQSVWYVKQELNNDYVAAQREVVAQEFFRLLIPSHPKTRLMEDEGKVYILSKEVPDFRSLEKIHDEDKKVLAKGVIRGDMKGLGMVVVTALLMDERDLKLGNMGLDNDGNIIKIDGDWCFSRMKKPGEKGHDITAYDFEHLPYIREYSAYNWLDVKSGLKIERRQHFITDNVVDSKKVRKEINQATLNILLMPDEVIRKMIEAHVPDKAEQDIQFKEIKNRQAQLNKIALRNKKFITYLASDAAKADYAAYLNTALVNFKTTSKDFLIDNEPDKRREFLAAQLSELDNFQRQAAVELEKIPKINEFRKAIQSDNKDKIEELLASGLDVNDNYYFKSGSSSDSTGTALHYAINNNYTEMITFLLDKGADPDIKDSAGKTAYDIAGEVGNLELLTAHRSKTMAAGEASASHPTMSLEEQLLDAVREGDENKDKVEFILVNNKSIDVNGLELLHGAVGNGCVELTDLLLKNGADPHKQDERGLTPLHYAAKLTGRDSMAVAKLLLAGPRLDENYINQKDKLGETALHKAIKHNNPMLVSYLLQKGADTKIASKREQTALDMAHEYGNDDVTEIIRRHNEKKQYQGLSPVSSSPTSSPAARLSDPKEETSPSQPTDSRKMKGS